MALEILIHPTGTKTTDSDKAVALSEKFPRSFRIAQDVLVATKKYHNKQGGLFSSEKSRIQTLQRAVYDLRDALESESFNFSSVSAQEATISKNTQADLVIGFLSGFSDAFPNWQSEYAVLNGFIPKCF
jgi:hypothetical protein